MSELGAMDVEIDNGVSILSRHFFVLKRVDEYPVLINPMHIVSVQKLNIGSMKDAENGRYVGVRVFTTGNRWYEGYANESVLNDMENGGQA